MAGRKLTERKGEGGRDKAERGGEKEGGRGGMEG